MKNKIWVQGQTSNKRRYVGLLLIASALVYAAVEIIDATAPNEPSSPTAATETDGVATWLSASATPNSYPALTGEQALLAKWSEPTALPLVPVTAALLSNGKVMLWASNTPNSFNASGVTVTAMFDPVTGKSTTRTVTETAHNMFCTGTARLADGSILLNGGFDPSQSSLYDPATDTWRSTSQVKVARGYTSTAMLADGSVLSLGGAWKGGAGAKQGEIFTVEGGWRLLSGLPDSTDFMLDGVYKSWQSNSHYSLIQTGNGKVLMAGPSVNMSWINTDGNGSYTPAGRRGDDGPAHAGNFVMYEAGKILKVGGSTWNENSPSSASAYIIDTTSGDVDVRKLPPMAYPRTYSNSVVMPNGQVLVVGGQTFTKPFSDTNAVLAPEIFDPVTNRFTTLPPLKVARNYHSVALLLPDARVLVGGGGLCNCAGDHPNLEIMTPPYLLNADGSAAQRPTITLAPDTLNYGSNVNVETSAGVTGFAMVRLGAVTHTVDNDQRRISVPFTQIDANRFVLNIPSNPGILLPGEWMLFALDAKGTPSMAKMVKVTNAGAPVLPAQAAMSASTGATFSSFIKVKNPSANLVYSATGLPAGMSINSSTGEITGKPAQAGKYLITVRVSNGTQTVSTDTTLDVIENGSGTGLRAQYFNNAQLSGTPALQTIQTVNFDWATNAPAAGVNADNFSARWQGFIEATSTGATVIRTNSDDGVRVWVNHQLVIDNWTVHAPTLNTASISMVAGQRYPITIEYNEVSGGAVMQLAWQPAGQSTFSVVPIERLYPGPVLYANNLAQGKVATQASTYSTAAASRAVDGNTNGVYSGNSVSHTNSAAPQDWWQVDLGSTNRIDVVQLWNRTDCCADRLKDFYVLVSPTDMTGKTLTQLLSDSNVIQRKVAVSNIAPVIGIPVNARGRFVRVQLSGQNFLQLAEVQVFGGPGIFHTPRIQPIGAQNGVVNTQFNLSVSASDSDGNPLTYAASGLPNGVSINATTGVIQGVPLEAGTFDVNVTVSNDGSSPASTRFQLTILQAVPAVQSLNAPIGSNSADISYSPSMLPGANAQYSWNFGDGTGDSEWSTSTTTSHRFRTPGVYTVTLTIKTDDGRLSTYTLNQAVTSGVTGNGGNSSTDVMVESRVNASARVWAVNGDNDSVSVFDTANNQRMAEIVVGAAPRTLARAPDGRIWVVNKAGSSISVINAGVLNVENTIALPRASQPYGLVFSPTENAAFVALEGLGLVLKLNASTGAVISSLNVGLNVRHVAINQAGNKLLVSRFITRALPGEGTANVQTVDANGNAVGADVLVIDPATMSLTKNVVLKHSERVDGSASGRGIPNYLGAAAFSPDGASAWVPSKQDNVKRGTLRDGNILEFKHTVRSVSSQIDLNALEEDPNNRVDFNLSSVASAAAFHPSGAYMFVTLETNRQVALVDAIGRRELARYDVGFAPQGLVVSPDGSKLYVNNFMSRTVSVLDLTPLVRSGQTVLGTAQNLNAITTDKLSATVLKGKQLFYDARDPRLARDSYMSCASCHNDGGHDGRVWDLTGQGEGLRNTISLRGRAGMEHGLLHWSANFDEIQDFEGQIRGLAGGTGLMSDADFNTGTRSQTLGDKKAGISPDLDALAAYVSSLSKFDPSPFRMADGTLTAEAKAGRLVFTKLNCAKCHGGMDYTLSGDASMLSNIGTIKPSSGLRLGNTLPGIDIPTLRDVWSTAPYLHDGSAATLADAVMAHNSSALSGATITDTELSNLVSFLNQIGSEAVEAPVPFTLGQVFGSASGTAFTDPVSANQSLTGLVLRTGLRVNSIQGLALPTNLPNRGTTTGTKTNVTWPSGEYLVSMSGTFDKTGVTSLTFKTNTGRTLGSYGVKTGTAFSFTVPSGQQIIGFTGRNTSTTLNAIGAVYGPR